MVWNNGFPNKLKYQRTIGMDMYLFQFSTDITPLKELPIDDDKLATRQIVSISILTTTITIGLWFSTSQQTPVLKKDPPIHFWEHQKMCLKTSLCQTKVELIRNQFRVTKLEDAFGTTALEEVEGNQLYVNSLEGNGLFWYSEGSVECKNLQSTQSIRTL